MPTYDQTEQFRRDYESLTPEERTQFKRAVDKFVQDLKAGGDFRGALRLKPMKDSGGIWEMTWEGRDGRATFEYGEEMTEGVPHIIWRRVGSHAVFGNP